MMDSEDPDRPPAHSRQLTSRATVTLRFPPTVDGFLNVGVFGHHAFILLLLLRV